MLSQNPPKGGSPTLKNDLENGKYDFLEIRGGVPAGEDIEKTLKKCMDLTDGSGDRWT